MWSKTELRFQPIIYFLPERFVFFAVIAGKNRALEGQKRTGGDFYTASMSPVDELLISGFKSATSVTFCSGKLKDAGLAYVIDAFEQDNVGHTGNRYRITIKAREGAGAKHIGR